MVFREFCIHDKLDLWEGCKLKMINDAAKHYVKSIQIQSFFWSVISCIWTEYGIYGVNLCIQYEYRKIRTRKISVFGHFSQSENNILKGVIPNTDV